MKKESCAAFLAAFDRDAAAMGLDDSIAHGKSQAGASLLFGRKKRAKDMRQGLGMNALTGVGYRDGQVTVVVSGCSDAQGSPGGHGVYRVKKKIDQNLFQWLWIAANAG